MGAVYLARRADGAFEQQVAIKLLNPALVGEQGRQRLESERQILANLNHPNIAHLVDGGTGIEPQTRQAWEACDNLNLPRLLFISGLDKDNSDWDSTLTACQQAFYKGTPLFGCSVSEGLGFRLIHFALLCVRE